MRLAADVSNHTGPLLPESFEQMESWGVKHLIAGIIDPAIAYEQLSMAFERGWEVDMYAQYNAMLHDDAFSLIQRCLTAGAGLPINQVFVTVEQPTSISGYREKFDAIWRQFTKARMTFSGRRVQLGIYTSRLNWLSLMGNTSDYRDAPLMYANYDHVQRLDAVLWRQQGFGGWWKPALKQYEAGSDNLGYVLDSGQRVDFSVSP